MIEFNDKIYLDSGKVLVTDEIVARMIAEGKEVPDHYRVGPSFDADVYKLIYQKDLSVRDDDFDPVSVNNKHTSKDVDRLLYIIESSPRYCDGDDWKDGRIEYEMKFFIDNDYVLFILKLKELIDKLKSDNKVWGVGRGSSCASYILYLLGVHDIDSVLYDIDFREFSKE